VLTAPTPKTPYYNAALAADDAPKPEPPPNKLTVAYYDFSPGKNGFDINLRHTFKTSTAWIGGYRESTGFDQARVGYEYDYHHEWLTLVPSALAATRGFVEASLYSEMGGRWFGIGGMGVTNLRPYWNLASILMITSRSARDTAASMWTGDVGLRVWLTIHTSITRRTISGGLRPGCDFKEPHLFT